MDLYPIAFGYYVLWIIGVIDNWGYVSFVVMERWGHGTLGLWGIWIMENWST